MGFEGNPEWIPQGIATERTLATSDRETRFREVSRFILLQPSTLKALRKNSFLACGARFAIKIITALNVMWSQLQSLESKFWGRKADVIFVSNLGICRVTVKVLWNVSNVKEPTTLLSVIVLNTLWVDQNKLRMYQMSLLVCMWISTEGLCCCKQQLLKSCVQTMTVIH